MKAAERLVKSTAPPAVDVINIAQLTEDITRKVLDQIQMRPTTPDSPTGADIEDDKLVFVVARSSLTWIPHLNRSLRQQPHMALGKNE